MDALVLLEMKIKTNFISFSNDIVVPSFNLYHLPQNTVIISNPTLVIEKRDSIILKYGNLQRIIWTKKSLRIVCFFFTNYLISV